VRDVVNLVAQVGDQFRGGMVDDASDIVHQTQRVAEHISVNVRNVQERADRRSAARGDWQDSGEHTRQNS